MSSPPRVLFLCTHNAARSILAEALFNHLAQGRAVAHSAGSTPRASGQPHPLALLTLTEAGIPTTGLSSKSWAQFMGSGAPRIDLVVTVCGNAQQACPLFPDAPAREHWPHDDPSAADLTEAQQRTAFQDTLQQLRQRIEAWLAALQGPPCPDCNGVGHILMSTCCGRGCATCPGPDAMLQAVPCWRCKGRGNVARATQRLPQ